MLYQRSGRKLKRNHSNALPGVIIIYDTETKPTANNDSGRSFSHVFRLGCAISARLKGGKATGITRNDIFEPADFWQLVYSLTGPRHTTWLISHNILFDLVVSGFADQFTSGNLSIDWPRSKRKREHNDPDDPHCSAIAVLKSPPTIIACRCQKTQGRLVMVDTLNWFPMSVKQLGEACKLPKLEMPAFEDSDDAWRAYCFRDCEILLHTFLELVRWVKESRFGMFRYTGPAQAMSAFRHRFMQHDICIHDNAEVRKFERTGYFGGRTEVFHAGQINQTVYQLDVNALFPSVMQTGLFPSKLVRYDLHDGYMELLPAIDWSCSLAEVDLITMVPLFACRVEHGVYYPIGHFRTVLCGRELAYAKRHGHIKAVKSWAEYQCEPLFAEWVTELWQTRQRYKAEGNALYEQFTKRIMNRLYGKFAQWSADWVSVEGAIAPEPW